MADELISQAEAARRLGVNRSTVMRWVRSGRLPADEGMVRMSDAARAARDSSGMGPHHQARKAVHEMERASRVRGGGRAPVASAGEDVDAQSVALMGADEASARYKAALAREREIKAELAAMELDRQVGLLLDRQEVDFVLADLGNTLRIKLEQAEDVLTEAVLPLRGDAAAIRQAVRETLREVLDDLAELMKRRMQEVTT